MTIFCHAMMQAHDSVSSSPRLPPIEDPASGWMRFIYWITRRRFGRVLTPVKVVYARVPGAAFIASRMKAVEDTLSVAPALRSLIRSLVAQRNGCSFCIDATAADAASAGVDHQKQAALPDVRDSPRFTPAERAALAFAEESTRDRTVSDETFQRVQVHFTDVQIAELTWLVAMENYFNLISRPLEISADGLCDLPLSSADAPEASDA